MPPLGALSAAVPSGAPPPATHADADDGAAKLKLTPGGGGGAPYGYAAAGVPPAACAPASGTALRLIRFSAPGGDAGAWRVSPSGCRSECGAPSRGSRLPRPAPMPVTVAVRALAGVPTALSGVPAAPITPPVEWRAMADGGVGSGESNVSKAVTRSCGGKASARHAVRREGAAPLLRRSNGG